MPLLYHKLEPAFAFLPSQLAGRPVCTALIQVKGSSLVALCARRVGWTIEERRGSSDTIAFDGDVIKRGRFNRLDYAPVRRFPVSLFDFPTVYNTRGRSFRPLPDDPPFKTEAVYCGRRSAQQAGPICPCRVSHDVPLRRVGRFSLSIMPMSRGHY